MPRVLPASGCFAVVLVAAAPGLAAGSLSAQTYFEDVRPILDQRCITCHSEAGVAFSLEDPEEAYDRRRRIGRAVARGAMPPWLAEAGHQDYVGDRSLSTVEIETIARWVAAEYPKGDRAAYAPPRRAPLAPAFDADVSLELIPGDSYLPPQDRTDEYRCFVLEWPQHGEPFITGFRGVPGNLNVAHHIVLYAAEDAFLDRFREFPEMDEGAGYTCFSGALPDVLWEDGKREAYEARYPDGLREMQRNHRWLAHWAPGMDGFGFPEGTGLPIRPGSAVIVQMHYYTGHAPGEADAGTRMEFTTASAVERPAYNFPFTHGRWFDAEENGSMVIPPGESATYELSASVEELLPEIARALDVDADSIRNLTIHSANLHMHRFGASGEITLTDRHGRVETLLSVPRWDLDWQRDFEFVTPKHVARDDFARTRMAVRCTYRNPSEQPVYGGLGSDDEMCFNLPYLSVGVGPERQAEEAGTEEPPR